MKANELRIGSLITFESEIIEVNYITTVSVGWKDHNFAPLCIKDAFKPIPLTEEWLLKFGFKKKNNKFRNDYYMFLDRWYIKESKNQNYSLVIHQDYVKHIRTIHEFQNLYFTLTGKELEVK